MKSKEPVELFSLKCAIVLANDPSPRSAAATLRVGVLSLLRRIHTVEAVLGQRFFHWNIEQVAVTPEAREFLKLVQPAVAVIDDAIAVFRSGDVIQTSQES